MLSLLRISVFTASILSGLTLASHLQVHDASFCPHYVLRVTLEMVPVACNVIPRILVNGTSPGPTIDFVEGETTWVRVYNDMQDKNLTMHWHGLDQAAAPFSDGTPEASQWPIKAQHFFDYEIKNKVGQAGTYFYHSHIQFQAVSAAGPLIVGEALGEVPYRFDGERTLFLSEVYNKTNEMVVQALQNEPESWSGEVEAILVNGQSYPALNGVQSGTPPPYAKPSQKTTCGPEVIEVEPGKTYRMRSIGGQALSFTSYMIEDHENLTVIAADGRYTKPAQTERIQNGPGQRFDFLLQAKNESELERLDKSMFWIQVQTRFRPTNVTSYAILKYTNVSLGNNNTIPANPPAKPPLQISTNIQNWLEYTLEPLKPNGFPPASEVTRTVYLDAAQRLLPKHQFWTVSNHTWSEVDEHLGNDTATNASYITGVPYLINIYENGQKAIPDFDLAVDKYGGWAPDLNVWPAQVGEIIDIILVNEPNGKYGGYDNHPWHIHGGHVWDMGWGTGAYNATGNEQKLQTYNPVLRDTTYLFVTTPAYVASDYPAYSAQGWRAWRLKVTDPGVWVVHCHDLQHMILSMQTVWVMGNATEITHRTEPYVQGYLKFGGSAYGNASYDPLVYHHYSDVGDAR